MAGPREREEILRRFHAANPGATSAALARGGSYHRLAALVPAGARVLDLGCGDGYLCEVLAGQGARAVGVDFSLEELAAFAGRAGADAAGSSTATATVVTAARSASEPPWPVAAAAQALPFRSGAFDAAVSHFAFMLMEDVTAVVAELARVLRPGGRFAALLGGGPTAGGDDAFHRFLALAGPRLRGPRFGDPRSRSERGWRELFAGWTDLGFERWELDLAGPFDEVWRFLGASYELSPDDAPAVRAALAAALADLTDHEGRVPCRIVAWLATATTATR